MSNCNRCNQETAVTTMSRFNTDMICLECDDKEQEHPDYQRAKDAEQAQVDAGNLNFPGVGKPADL